MTAEMILFPVLLYLAIVDIRKRKILLSVPIIGTIVILCMHYLCEKEVICFLVPALLFCVFFLLVSKWTHDQIGSGDALVLGMTGACFGFVKNIYLLYCSFFLAFLYGIFLIIWKRRERCHVMPFLPFVFLGAVAVFLGDIYL